MKYVIISNSKFYTIYGEFSSMKKRILFYCVLGVLSVLVTIGGRILHRNILKQTQEPISMIIASDIHYLSPDYRGEYFKEPSAMFDGKLVHYSSEYFDAFLSEVIEKHPQVLILSGDITLNGSLKSHEEVTSKLEKVQEAGTTVLVIPGNHDLHVTAGDYSPEEPVSVPSTYAENFCEMYENFGPAQASSRDSESFSYIYEASPYLKILMLDTNTLSKGFVADSTLLWIEDELKKAKSAGADVIAVSHQNLHIHSDLLYFSYQLYNADDLFALFEKYDVDLNLSGHIHIQSVVTESTVPEIAVGALSICKTPYGEIVYDGKTIQYTTSYTDVSAYAKEQGFTDENLLNFENYSTYYFEEVGRLQNYASFEETELTEDEKTLLADTFAEINALYFLGQPYNKEDFSEGIALWRTQKDDFTLKYIESMLKESDVDNQNVTIYLK